MDKSEIAKKKTEAYELGYQFEGKWGNCAQATMWAATEALNIESYSEQLKVISAFHAGGGGLCDGSCGAYIAGSSLIAARFGRSVEQLGTDSEDPRATKTTLALNDVIARYHKKFIEEYGTVICTNIHRRLYGRTFHLHDQDDKDKFDAAGAHDWGCTSVVGKAAAWAVEILLENETP